MASLHVYEMFERCILQIQSLISRARRDSRDVCGKACARTFIYPRRVSVLCDFFEKKHCSVKKMCRQISVLSNVVSKCVKKEDRERDDRDGFIMKRKGVKKRCVLL